MERSQKSVLTRLLGQGQGQGGRPRRRPWGGLAATGNIHLETVRALKTINR